MEDWPIQLERRRKVKGAIIECRPRAVILTGIAAGFPEAGVEPGDILVPHWIVGYERLKIHEISASVTEPSPSTRRPPVMFQHRGEPLPVAETLWIAADALNDDPGRPRLEKVLTKRPSGPRTESKIHVDKNFKLGSGDKLVASECRMWLLNKFGENATGLEMKAHGTLTACRDEEIPCLIVKAVQDPATGEKDNAATKDIWRVYACDAAAAFVATLIERFTFRDERLWPAVRTSKPSAIREAHAAVEIKYCRAVAFPRFFASRAADLSELSKHLHERSTPIASLLRLPVARL